MLASTGPLYLERKIKQNNECDQVKTILITHTLPMGPRGSQSRTELPVKVRTK